MSELLTCMRRLGCFACKVCEDNVINKMTYYSWARQVRALCD